MDQIDTWHHTLCAYKALDLPPKRYHGVHCEALVILFLRQLVSPLGSVFRVFPRHLRDAPLPK